MADTNTPMANAPRNRRTESILDEEQGKIDEDLPLNSFTAIHQFMRRRSAWLCVAGACLAYIAFIPPLLVVVPLMTNQFCLEWAGGVVEMLAPAANQTRCMGLQPILDMIPEDFYDKATVSNLSSDFSTPTGRVFLACILLSSLALLISDFPFWLPRRWKSKDGQHSVFDSGEGALRFVWLVVGTLSAAIVAVIPSPAEAQGNSVLLTAMHNVGAVVGYGVLVFMELAQLHLGENVFRRARNAIRRYLGNKTIVMIDPDVKYQKLEDKYEKLEEQYKDRDYWELNWDQWLRGAIMIVELATGVTFIAVQGALFFGVRSQAVAYYSVFLETGFALLIYGDLFVMGLHGCVMDIYKVKP